MKNLSAKFKNGLKGLKMRNKDIKITELEKKALTKDEKSTYYLMNIYYGLSNTVLNTLTTDDYKNQLIKIIGEN